MASRLASRIGGIMERPRSVEALAHLIGSVEAVERAFQIAGPSPSRAPVTGDPAVSDLIPDRPSRPVEPAEGAVRQHDTLAFR